jgi:peptidoglycan/LPS O-acetylase OafA/YrhL
VLTIVAPISALIAIVLAYKYVSSFNHSAAPRLAGYRYVIVFNIFAGIGFAAALGTRLDRATRSVPVLRRSSDYSYTLYVVHYPILLFAFGVLQLYIQRSLFAAAATALVSLIAIVFFAKRAALLVESRPALTAFFGQLRRVRN